MHQKEKITHPLLVVNVCAWLGDVQQSRIKLTVRQLTASLAGYAPGCSSGTFPAGQSGISDESIDLEPVSPALDASGLA